MAGLVLTTFDWVPEMPRGFVRDIRIRWALEEAGLPYKVESTPFKDRKTAHFAHQPFGQVPWLTDDGLSIFESGAILLYIAEKHGVLLPKDENQRWQAIAWLFAGLNSVEPSLMRYFAYDVFNAGKDWAEGAKKAVLPLLRQKLKRVSDALGDNDWLAGGFSIADIMMVTVINNLKDTGFVAEYPNLAAYHARGTGRPAYKRALAAQLADFDGPAPQGRG